MQYRKRKIYLASSWRNKYYETALDFFSQDDRHEVYNFKNPAPFLPGFRWESTSALLVKQWGPSDLLEALDHPIAKRNFLADFSAMKWCDTLILLLPCGRSAHLEAGWAVGAGKNVHIVLHEEKFEPELMYRMADAVHLSIEDCSAALT